MVNYTSKLRSTRFLTYSQIPTAERGTTWPYNWKKIQYFVDFNVCMKLVYTKFTIWHTLSLFVPVFKLYLRFKLHKREHIVPLLYNSLGIFIRNWVLLIQELKGRSTLQHIYALVKQDSQPTSAQHFGSMVKKVRQQKKKRLRKKERKKERKKGVHHGGFSW